MAGNRRVSGGARGPAGSSASIGPLTPGTIPIANGVTTITDSLLTISGGTINIGYAIAAMAGALTVAGTLQVSGIPTFSLSAGTMRMQVLATAAGATSEINIGNASSGS